jgi:hypothetical protein
MHWCPGFNKNVASTKRDECIQVILHPVRRVPPLVEKRIVWAREWDQFRVFKSHVVRNSSQWSLQTNFLARENSPAKFEYISFN